MHACEHACPPTKPHAHAGTNLQIMSVRQEHLCSCPCTLHHTYILHCAACHARSAGTRLLHNLRHSRTLRLRVVHTTPLSPLLHSTTHARTRALLLRLAPASHLLHTCQHTAHVEIGTCFTPANTQHPAPHSRHMSTSGACTPTAPLLHPHLGRHAGRQPGGRHEQRSQQRARRLVVQRGQRPQHVGQVRLGEGGGSGDQLVQDDARPAGA